MRRRTTTGALVALLLGLPVPPPHAAAGVLTGTVRLAGPAPARPPMPVFKNAEVCGEHVIDERLVVGPAGGVRYAVVTVEGVAGGRKPERDVTVTLDNQGCRFVPHVQTAEVGQWLALQNSDPVLHNADARMGPDTLFNVALTPGRRIRKPLARAGRIDVTCDVRHTWMSAFIVVADHPYHTVTDAYGAYEIHDVPGGTYAVRVWHETLGTLERSVTVPADGTATLDVEYAAAGEARR
ncbi:MAG TPA: carboxypeptidase regulatory-like domain-containing protein [Candidatus Binatia bacterium]|nr:carboxypeptidase regulatory-like domain-containing protein [Candidatus Binatia bacterium]